jgi:hypothetical protein
VIVVRNPDAVAASLARRNAMNAGKAQRLWLAHLHGSLIHTIGQPRMFVLYEDVMHDWPAELQRLAAFIGRPERADDPGVQAEAAEFIDRELCHHNLSAEALAGNARIGFPTKGLYVALTSVARTESAGNNGAGAGRARSSITSKALDQLSAHALESWDRTVEVAAERDALKEASQLHAAAIATLTAAQHRLEVTVSLLEADVRLAVAERDRHTHEREAAEQALQAAERTLREIEGSVAWRVVTWLRRGIVALFPRGTRRREKFHSLLRRVTRRLPSARTERSIDTSGTL